MRLLLLVPFAAVAACTRDAPPVPQASASSSASTAALPTASSAALVPPAASASAAPLEIEHLVWELPPSWRDLSVSLQGVQKGHFQALIEDPKARVPEEVEVFVVHHQGARGDTPEAKVADALKHEADAFTKVEFRKTETRTVNG